MYYEYVENLTKRGKFLTPFELSKVKPYSKPLYRSMFGYDDDIIDYYEKNKTTSGYAGNRFIQTIILDVDTKESAIEDTINVIERIYELGLKEENFALYFSGHKGFHIHLPNIFDIKPSPDAVVKVKTLLYKVFIQQFDKGLLDNIYDAGRIIRLPLSINTASNLYKVPLTVEELHKGIEYIMEKATKNDYELHKIKPIIIDIPKDEPLIVQLKEITPIQNSSNMRHLSRKYICIENMLSNPAIVGHRHKMLLVIVSTLLRIGTPENMVYKQVKEWSNLDNDELEKIFKSVKEKGYHYSCENEYMMKYCDKQCIYYNRKEDKFIETAKDILEKYKYMLNTEYIDLDKYYKCGIFRIYPEELVIIMGDTGTNKSTLVQNLVTLFGKSTLYINTEMGGYLLLRRFNQIIKGNKQIDETDIFDNITFINDKITLEQLESAIYNINPKILVVDVLEDIITNAKDSIQAGSIIATELKAIAKKYKIIVIAVHHINKQAGLAKTVSVHAAKGASTIVQKADKVLFITAEDNKRILNTLKSRDENKIKLEFVFDPITFRLINIKELYEGNSGN